MRSLFLIALAALSTACTFSSAIRLPDPTEVQVGPPDNTAPPTPPTETGDLVACSGNPPTVANATIADLGALLLEQAVFEISFIGVADVDGDLTGQSTYILLVDDNVNQMSDPNALGLQAPFSSADTCSVFNVADAVFQLPVSQVPEIFPSACTPYELALYVLDDAGLSSDPIFVSITTPSVNGEPCP